ncbi:MAG: DMT family transporter [Desulfobacteraceae bacterium]|nr:DMT family transporter [Desulfobacteraceae bacterium]
MAALILGAMLWATSFVVLKAAIGKYHPYMVIFGRMMVATVIFLPVFYRYRHTWKIRSGSWSLILFMGFCEPCLYFLMEVAALERTTASQAGMITAMLPLMVALGSYIFLKERISTPMVIGFFMAVAGAIWLSLAGKPEPAAPNPILGNFLEFLAMVCATGYIICAKRLTGNLGYPPFMITAVQAMIGFVFYLPLLCLPGIDISFHFKFEFLWAILYLGAFITIGAYGFYNYGVSKVPASHAAVFINLIPVFSVIFARIFLGEKFNIHQYSAAAIILLGIFISQHRKKQKTAVKSSKHSIYITSAGQKIDP